MVHGKTRVWAYLMPGLSRLISCRKYACAGQGLMVALLLIASFQSLHAGECDQCPTPDIVRYDFAVKLPTPEALKDYYNWIGHFSASRFAGAEICKTGMFGTSRREFKAVMN